MKNPLRLCSVVLCFSLASTFAGTAMSEKNSSTVDTNSTPSLSYEFDVQDTFVGEGSVSRGGYRVEDFDENDFSARYIWTPRIKFGILRLGAAYERFDFGIGADDQIRNGVSGGKVFSGLAGNVFVPFRAELPDKLQAANAIVGLDSEFSESLLFRIEAHPGFYGAGSDLFRSDNFRIPFIFGMTYVYSPTVQFTLGVGVDFEGKYPVLPGGGVRWVIAPKWTLNAVVPTPRLEYEVSKDFTLYGGATIKSDTYRVQDDFGSNAGNTRLNNAHLTYSEVRVGLGADWKIAHGVTLSLEGGYLPYRTFDYSRVHVRYTDDGGAPYGGIALKAAF